MKDILKKILVLLCISAAIVYLFFNVNLQRDIKIQQSIYNYYSIWLWLYIYCIFPLVSEIDGIKKESKSSYSVCQEDLSAHFLQATKIRDKTLVKNLKENVKKLTLKCPINSPLKGHLQVTVKYLKVFLPSW